MDLANMRIEDMEFANKVVGSRIRNVLLKNGITTLDQLLKHSEWELRDMRNFGSVSLAELTVKLKRMGLELRREEKW